MPQVDFAPFLLGVADGKAEVARDIGTACEGIGFFYLIGHGIPAEMPDDFLDGGRNGGQPTGPVLRPVDGLRIRPDDREASIRGRGGLEP